MSAHVDPKAVAVAQGPERRALLKHLAACAACRDAAVAEDPSILFALLSLAPMPEPLLDDVSTEVARWAGRDREDVAGFSGVATLPRRLAVAAVFTLTLLTGYATLRKEPAGPPVLSKMSRRADVDVTPGRGVSQVIDLSVGDTQIVMVYNGDLKL